MLVSKYGYRCEGRRFGAIRPDCNGSLYGLSFVCNASRKEPSLIGGSVSRVGIDGEVVVGKVVQYDLIVAGFEDPGGPVGLGRLRLVLGSIGSFRSGGPPMPCRRRHPGDVERASR